MPRNVVSVAKRYIRTVMLMSNLYFDLLGQSCEEFCLRHGKTGNKKSATCFATLLQNELNGDVARFTTNVQTCILFIARQVLFGWQNAQHRYSTRFAAMLQNKLHVFSYPVFRHLYWHLYLARTIFRFVVVQFFQLLIVSHFVWIWYAY